MNSSPFFLLRYEFNQFANLESDCICRIIYYSANLVDQFINGEESTREGRASTHFIPVSSESRTDFQRQFLSCQSVQ